MTLEASSKISYKSLEWPEIYHKYQSRSTISKFFHSSELEKVEDDICNQLKLRKDFNFQKNWIECNGLCQVVSKEIMKAFGWPNNHFLPNDKLEILFFSSDCLRLGELNLELMDKFDFNLELFDFDKNITFESLIKAINVSA